MKNRLGQEFYYIPDKISFIDIINELGVDLIKASEIGITTNIIDDITGADIRRARQRGWDVGDIIDTADSATILNKDVKYIEVRRPSEENDKSVQGVVGIIMDLDGTLFLATSDNLDNLPASLTELTVKRGKSIWKTTNAGRNWELIVGSGKRWMDGNELKDKLGE
jgi:hypothetical protein